MAEEVDDHVDRRAGEHTEVYRGGRAGDHPDQPTVRLLIDGAVATIELNRPHRRNALDLRLLEELEGALQQLHRERSARAVVLCGAGPSFCAGHDLAQDDLPTDVQGVRRYVERLQRCTQLLRELPVVSIAAVHGHAVGAGAELALACDLVVAADDAVLRFPEVEAGLAIGGGSAWALPQLVGLAVARQLVLLGRPLTAARAAELGLVVEVSTPDRLRQVAHELAAELTDRPPLALELARSLLQRGAEGSLAEALVLETEHMTLTALASATRPGDEPR